MTDEEIEKALKDRAYEISYGDHNDKWIVPKDKLSQETLEYINRLKEACESAIQSFTRMETLYKVKCTELECAKEQIRKNMAKEILQEFIVYAKEQIRGDDDYSFAFRSMLDSLYLKADELGVELDNA